MNSQVQHLGSVPQTITAGAAAVTLVTSNDAPMPFPGPGTVANTAITARAKIAVENSSVLTAAPVTIKLQKRLDGAGSWVDLVSETYSLRGLVGLTAADRGFLDLETCAEYDGGDNVSMAIRLAISCTGANISVLNASLRTSYHDVNIT